MWCGSSDAVCLLKKNISMCQNAAYSPIFIFPKVIFILPILKQKAKDSTTESQSYGYYFHSLTLIKDNNWSKHLPENDPTPFGLSDFLKQP